MKVIDTPVTTRMMRSVRWECGGVHVEAAKAGSPALAITSDQVSYPAPDDPCGSKFCPAMTLMIKADLASIFPELAHLSASGLEYDVHAVIEIQAVREPVLDH